MMYYGKELRIRVKIMISPSYIQKRDLMEEWIDIEK